MNSMLKSTIPAIDIGIENLGFPRVETILRIDNRNDVDNSVKRKIKYVE